MYVSTKSNLVTLSQTVAETPFYLPDRSLNDVRRAKRLKKIHNTGVALTLNGAFSFSSNFGLVSPDGQMESDAYKPIVHWHRWAQKLKILNIATSQTGSINLCMYYNVVGRQVQPQLVNCRADNLAHWDQWHATISIRPFKINCVV